MAPLLPPTPDDIEAAGPLLGKLGAAIGWVVGVLAVLYAGIKEIIRVGGEKRRYEELREDVTELKESRKLYLTIVEHESQTELCHARLAKLSADQLNAVVKDLKEDMETMNANLFRLMGAMQVDPVVSPKKRRRTDAP